MSDQPLRPEERDEYGTPVATPAEQEATGPEPGPAPPSATPPWIALGCVALLLLLALLVAWILFAALGGLSA